MQIAIEEESFANEDFEEGKFPTISKRKFYTKGRLSQRKWNQAKNSEQPGC